MKKTWGLSIILISFGAIIKVNQHYLAPRTNLHSMDFPEMVYPKDNLPTEARILLGRKLFFDPVLSSDSSISCSSCHQPQMAFADKVRVTPGVENRLGLRNAPTLGNVGYQPYFMFDGLINTLEQQALVPIEEHAEMNFNVVEISKRLKKEKTNMDMAQKAYSQTINPFVITRALAAFQRTLVTKNSKYDFYRMGQSKLSKDEKKGENLFYNVLNCAKCHGGFNFTNFNLVNNGLIFSKLDSGRMRVTELETDRDVVKIPSLRNIALTAPYMHDGRFNTLKEVIHHYKKGGEGAKNKHPSIVPFELTLGQEKQLILFLQTLTDKKFVNNKAFREIAK